jgi:outer membrane lipoprotein carrier protein
MKNRVIKIFFIVLSLTSLQTIAKISASDSLENTLSHINTLQANFTETITSGNHVNQKLSGIFMLKKPGKFFWQTLRPIHQDIISDGKKIWVYDKDLEQIMVKSLEQNVGETPALLLNGKRGTISKNYRVVMRVNSSQNTQIYILTPKEKLLYNYIQITMKGNTLTHMRFEDALGQYTDFSFTEVKLNHDLPNSVFIFKPPKNVDIVHG